VRYIRDFENAARQFGSEKAKEFRGAKGGYGAKHDTLFIFLDSHRSREEVMVLVKGEDRDRA
jgi:hypothetical protein